MKISAASANPDNVILSKDTDMRIEDTANPLLSDNEMTTEKYFLSCETQTFCSSIAMVTVACQTDFSSVESACQTEPQCALEETEKSEKIDAYAQWTEYEYNYFGEMGKVT